MQASMPEKREPRFGPSLYEGSTTITLPGARLPRVVVAPAALGITCSNDIVRFSCTSARFVKELKRGMFLFLSQIFSRPASPSGSAALPESGKTQSAAEPPAPRTKEALRRAEERSEGDQT